MAKQPAGSFQSNFQFTTWFIAQCILLGFVVVVLLKTRSFCISRLFSSQQSFCSHFPMISYSTFYVTHIYIKKKKSQQKQLDFIMRREKRCQLLQEYHANSNIPTLTSGARVLKDQVRSALKEKRTGIINRQMSSNNKRIK